MRVDRIVIGPLVVGLPGIVGALKQNLCRAIIANDENHVALPVSLRRIFFDQTQPTEIDSAHPVAGNRQCRRRGPAAFSQMLFAEFGSRLFDTGKRTKSFHQPSAASTVITGTKDLDLERMWWIGRHHDVDRFPSGNTLLGAIAFDPG